MTNKFSLVKAPAFDNDVDAYIPEQWALSGLLQLRENMVMPRLLHTDFSPQFASFGDVVNTRRPAEFKGRRKARGSDVTIQNATATNVQVKLNQHIHTTFRMYDTDASKAFAQLEMEFLVPAVRALCRTLDQICTGQWVQYRTKAVGKLSSAASKAGVVAVGSKLDVAKAPVAGRSLVVNPATNATLLTLAEFTEVDKTADTAGLREAQLGRKYGLDIYMAQNMPIIDSSVTPATVVGAINNGAGYAAGSTSLVVDGFTGDVAPAGAYVTIGGDDRPRRIASRTLTSSNTTGIVLAEPLDYAVVDDAVVTVFGGPLVNLVAGYDADYDEGILYDGAGSGKAPMAGQLLSFGTASAEYAVIEVDDNGDGTGTLWLDRPLDASVANDVRINLGPNGSFNFGLVRDAITLAMRPLAAPKGGGANTASVSDEQLGLGLRVIFAYDWKQQCTVVTLDFLAGIKVLDSTLGVVYYTSDTL